MIPTYRNMDSYPFHRNHIPSSHYYHPAMEQVPPQMTKSPFPYDHPWPYPTSSYGPHFCYDHNNFPGYYSQRPCYPHVPHTPAYSGGCPLYGEPFSAPYYPQSHNYSMQLPRYEYDKYMPRDRHCCGCPNHLCNQKEDKTVKIEEQEPNVGKKENDSMVPIQFRNFPYPLVWIPSEYYGDKQPKNPTKAEVEEHEDKVAHDKKLSGAENVNAGVQPEFEPRLWNGWLPFDVRGTPNVLRDGDEIRGLKKETGNNMKESENGRMDQKDKSEQLKRSEFPFPFIWFPYVNKEEEGGRTNNQKSYSTPERVEEVPHTFKSFPVKSPIDEGATKSTDVVSKGRSASDVTDKVSNQRNIPVKQIEPNHVKNDSKVSEKREMNVSEENVMKKDSNSISKQRSTSPPKRSKLPPVCLRVDPLPRKKSGNGSSRSPSPPASKEHSKAIACETNNTPTDNMADKTERSSNIHNVPKAGEEVTPKVKTIEVSQNIPSDNMTDKTEVSLNIQNVPKAGEEVTPKLKTNEVSQSKTNENKGANTETDEGCKKERRVLSDRDAAVLIQAVYRGHLVRKWESLKKLKQIAEVSKEVTYVRDCVKALEGSSDFRNDGKQKIAIGETIMRLLLKLDTIQGLHPSLREIRKSLARELVTLQERLDSITADKYPQQQMQEFDAKESVEVSPMSIQNGEHNQEHQEETSTSQQDSSEVISDRKHQDQLYMEDNRGGSESPSHIDPASIEGTTPTVLWNRTVSEDVSQVVADEALDSTSKPSDKADGECELKSEVIDIPLGVDKLDTTGLEELPVGVIDENVIGDSASEGLDSDTRSMPVLPVGVLDEDTTTSDETNTSDMDAMKVLPVGVLNEDAAKLAKSEEKNTSDVHAMKVLPVGALDEDAATSGETMDEMKVLPVGVLDEDAAKSEETNTSDMHAMEVLPVGVLDEDADMDAMKVLPVGVLDEDAAKSEETNTSDMRKMKVLPVGVAVGVLDEDAAKSEETNTSESEVQAENEVLKEELPVGLLDEDAEKSEAEKSEYNTKETQLEQSQVEEKEEVKSNEESDGWVKIELQKEDDELKVDAPVDIEDSGTGNATKLSSPESPDHGNEEACLEGNDIANMSNEKLAQQESKVDAELNGDMKLLEENEKLRKLMKELLEAGNEQLSVISNLTGRVKDLEKKLAKTKRNKKVRTKRHKSVTPKMHCSNSSE